MPELAFEQGYSENRFGNTFRTIPLTPPTPEKPIDPDTQTHIDIVVNHAYQDSRSNPPQPAELGRNISSEDERALAKSPPQLFVNIATSQQIFPVVTSELAASSTDAVGFGWVEPIADCNSPHHPVFGLTIRTHVPEAFFSNTNIQSKARLRELQAELAGDATEALILAALKGIRGASPRAIEVIFGAASRRQEQTALTTGFRLIKPTDPSQDPTAPTIPKRPIHARPTHEVTSTALAMPEIRVNPYRLMLPVLVSARP